MRKIIIVCFLVGFIIFSTRSSVQATPSLTLSAPYTTIRVLSVQIRPIVHTKVIPVYICGQNGNQPRYGCGYTQNQDGTWPIDEDESGATNRYPFTSNPVTLNVESQYLPNVVPIESPPDNGFGSTALQAQAVVARTYAYNNIDKSAPGDLYDVENHTGF